MEVLCWDEENRAAGGLSRPRLGRGISGEASVGSRISELDTIERACVVDEVVERGTRRTF